MKKTMCLLISLLLLAAAGCNSRETKQKEDEYQEEITFTLFNVDGGEAGWEDPIALAITEATGVSLKIEYPQEDSDKMIQMMIATSNYTDFVYAKGDGNQLIENNALIDMSELIEVYGPNIKKLYGEHYDWLRYSKDDPSIYQLCSQPLTDSDQTANGSVQLQYAVLEANDYQIPTTLDEYEKMIKDYLAENPVIDGKEAIGISIICSDWRWMVTMANPSGFIANGSPDNGQWIIDDDLNVIYKHTAQNQKEYFQWLNRMYHEGILDPDFATHTYEDYQAKISEGRVISLMDAEWNYGEALLPLVKSGRTERTYASLPVILDSSIPYREHASSTESVGWGIGISKSCKDPVRAIQFLDYICSDEGQVLLRWGIEGVHYEVDEDGQRYRPEEEMFRLISDPDYKAETGIGLHNYPFPTYGDHRKDSTGNYYSDYNREDKKRRYNDAEKKAIEAWGVEYLSDIFPELDDDQVNQFPPLWSWYLPSQVLSQIKVLDEIAWNGLIKCVIDEQDAFEVNWNELQLELVNNGAAALGEYMTELLSERLEFWQSFE